MRGRMPAPKRTAALIVRRDGRDAVLAKPEAQGWYRPGDLHACHFALYRESEQVGLCLVTIQVSGTAGEVLRQAPVATGAELEQLLDVVAECALGDFLDQLEQVPLAPRSPPRDVFLDANGIRELLNRSRAPEAETIRYLAAKTYWSTKLHQVAAGFRSPDARRLGHELRDLRVVADAYDGQWWTYMADPHPDCFYLRSSRELMHSGPRLVGAAVAGPVFDIRDFLAGAPSEASAQQFRKALTSLTSDSPDYENAIKDAVGALESRARQMTGASTLGRAIDMLVQEARIPRSFGRWLTAMWEYRSSEPAVGHGGLTPADTEASEARAMVNSCAAALLYLLALNGDTRPPTIR